MTHNDHGSGQSSPLYIRSLKNDHIRHQSQLTNEMISTIISILLFLSGGKIRKFTVNDRWSSEVLLCAPLLFTTKACHSKYVSDTLTSFHIFVQTLRPCVVICSMDLDSDTAHNSPFGLCLLLLVCGAVPSRNAQKVIAAG